MEESAEFRKRVGRRKGGQKEHEETTKKKKDWDVMICGDCDDSYESDFMPRNASINLQRIELLHSLEGKLAMQEQGCTQRQFQR